MSPQHTPGPWRVDQDVFSGSVRGPQNELVAFVYPAAPDNADLIATAPKLLAALKELHAVMLELPPQHGNAPAAMTRAWFAIAEAEGREL